MLTILSTKKSWGNFPLIHPGIKNFAILLNYKIQFLLFFQPDRVSCWINLILYKKVLVTLLWCIQDIFHLLRAIGAQLEIKNLKELVFLENFSYFLT